MTEKLEKQQKLEQEKKRRQKHQVSHVSVESSVTTNLVCAQATQCFHAGTEVPLGKI